eukprot:scaffold147980_cov20-Prasinocladus_malaysianus.AAC.1
MNAFEDVRAPVDLLEDLVILRVSLRQVLEALLQHAFDDVRRAAHLSIKLVFCICQARTESLGHVVSLTLQSALHPKHFLVAWSFYVFHRFTSMKEHTYA